MDHRLSLPGPLGIFRPGASSEDSKPQLQPVVWTTRGIGEQDYPWAAMETSYQRACFKKILAILQSRNNKVLVMVGPFNQYVMTQESLRRYAGLKSEIESWLKRNQVSYIMMPDLPNEAYADTSHPLAEGYRLMAGELLKTDFIKSIAAGKATP